jgi:hypothetical protein
MRLANWIVFIVSFCVLAWFLINVNLWGEAWKDLFFYTDNWLMWAGLFIGLILLKEIVSRFLKLELRILK